MFLPGNNMEIVVFCSPFNRNDTVTYSIQMIMRDIVLKHTSKKDTTVFLYWHSSFHPWNKTYKIAKETDNDVRMRKEYLCNALLYLT